MNRFAPTVLKELVAHKVEMSPNLDVLTFEGAGVRGDEVRTYRDLWENGNRLAGGLIDRGMMPGDRFALFMKNHPEFVDAMVAASISRCVFVPIDPRTRGTKLAYMLNHSGCRGVIAADYTLGQIEGVRADLAGLEWIWVLDSDEALEDNVKHKPGISHLAAILNEPFVEIGSRHPSPKDPFEITYTSGTTGDPKGVVRSNESYIDATAFGSFVQLAGRHGHGHFF